MHFAFLMNKTENDSRQSQHTEPTNATFIYTCMEVHILPPHPQRAFTVWMNVLRRVRPSELVLMQPSSTATAANLVAEAAARGMHCVFVFVCVFVCVCVFVLCVCVHVCVLCVRVIYTSTYSSHRQPSPALTTLFRLASGAFSVLVSH